MLFTGKNPIILYPFPEILINLSRLRYFPKPVRSPFLVCDTSYAAEGLPGVLGNKGTKGKYRREQGNMTPVLGNTGT